MLAAARRAFKEPATAAAAAAARGGVSIRSATMHAAAASWLRRAAVRPAVLQHARRSYHQERNCYGFRQPEPEIRQIEPAGVDKNRIENANLFRLASAYRRHAHKRAAVDPLGIDEYPAFEMDLARFGLDLKDPTERCVTGIVDLGGGRTHATTAEVVAHLERTYCGAIGVEFMHAETEHERDWFKARFEQLRNETSFSAEERRHYAKLLIESEVFDQFMQKRFGQVKRYGAEGAESMHVAIAEMVSYGGGVQGIREFVMSMPHRGRLNLLTGYMQLDPTVLFHKLQGNSELPEGLLGRKLVGDVISHLTNSVDVPVAGARAGTTSHVSMIPNPSHLEAANPVAVGKARAKQMFIAAAERPEDCKLGDRVLCLQIHGDAAVTAQGVVTETFGFANLPHYHVGGSVHLIVNNQVGFTTPAARGRSSRYASDVGKMINAPVLHVNGDQPDEVALATRMAMEYRHRFRRDVIIDLYCFRRWGHNELDDPSFTQPRMYEHIRKRNSVPQKYQDLLVADGTLGADEAAAWRSAAYERLAGCLEAAPAYRPAAAAPNKWSGVPFATSALTTVETGVALDVLRRVGEGSVAVPDDGFTVHPRLQKSHVDSRLRKLKSGRNLDWATAEALAFGSLLLEGRFVRISGQDVGRGTFSHRHAMLVDQAQGDRTVLPLNSLAEEQGRLEVANSHLSEFAVLGFEYGVSFENPDTLPIWEAQFGDFANGAQIVIDTFVASGEAKWGRQSGLVISLPHGYDGAGPEHSSARLERFLQLTDSEINRADGDDVNLHVINPTTPAQIFHALRRQMCRPFRKPLVVAAPKTLLRLSAATSTLDHMGPGTHFHHVLDDPDVADADRPAVRRVALCSGKLYYELAKQRADRGAGAGDVALVRLEQLSPFPAADLARVLDAYGPDAEVVWAQEEQQNAGAYTFVAPRVRAQLGRDLRYVGRGPLAAPAIGIGKLHKAEVAQLYDDVFA